MPNKASSKFAPPFHPVPQLRRKCKFFLVAPPSARKHFLGKMAAVSVFQAPVGGFSFDNCRRYVHAQGRDRDASRSSEPGVVPELGCGLGRRP